MPSSSDRESSYLRELILFGGLFVALAYWLTSSNAAPFIIALMALFVVGPPDEVQIKPEDVGITVGTVRFICGLPPTPPEEKPQPHHQETPPT